jgi:hypothetical protein
MLETESKLYYPLPSLILYAGKPMSLIHHILYSRQSPLPPLTLYARQPTVLSPLSRIHERTISLRFLGIILRILRLEFSVDNVYITNDFAQGGEEI